MDFVFVFLVWPASFRRNTGGEQKMMFDPITDARHSFADGAARLAAILSGLSIAPGLPKYIPQHLALNSKAFVLAGQARPAEPFRIATSAPQMKA
jgi:hypothetical protein